ncbi:MAG: hypothetical protein KKB30_08780 [Proteobacteria bacterium]|nr:hypothetical protein [Pseudomonadota bacterium]MBU1716883.1 hypothetical protein [Pseudomonadota bacterium]
MTIIILSLFILVSGCFTSALAKDPWQWQFSLRGDQPNDDKTKPMLLPGNIFVDQELERYYVADAGNNRLLSFKREGIYLNAFSASNKLKTPTDIVREKDGLMWVIEKGRNSLTEIDLKEKKIENHSLQYRGVSVFPDRLFIDGENTYLLDKSSGDIILFDRKLKGIKHYGCPECTSGFIDFTVKSGNIWALARTEKAVYKFNTDGPQSEKIQLKGSLAFPFALEIGPAGLLYILDRHNGTIAVFDQTGSFKYNFLSKGHGRGELYYPEDLLFDPWGRLCVVDSGNGRVEIFSR